jgi:hypothetical protein
MIVATVAAGSVMLTIPSCDSDLAVVNVRVHSDGGALVSIARVRDASDASEVHHPLIRGTGTVHTTNLSIQVNRAQAKHVNELDIGGIRFNMFEENRRQVMEVSFPPSKQNTWYISILPRLDAALDVQSLRQDPFKRRLPSDPPLTDSRLDEIAAESERLRLSFEVVVPWDIGVNRIDNRGAKAGWRTMTPDKKKGVLLIPLDYPELAGDAVVWRLESR